MPPTIRKEAVTFTRSSRLTRCSTVAAVLEFAVVRVSVWGRRVSVGGGAPCTGAASPAYAVLCFP